MKRVLALLALICSVHSGISGTGDNPHLQPRLVVGIVIDQMRYDYLYRYYDQYGERGFKRLMKEGMNFTYAHYNYIPTYTGPGHASIYTGTTPYNHGIISNDWYDRKSKKEIYCVSDPGYTTVGAGNAAGRMSPVNLVSTTMTDQLRMSNNGLSRVFSLSIKDRAAILPGGHMANGVYWYDGESGNFITSTFYLKELPSWVKMFNDRKLVSRYMRTAWSLEPGKNYETSLPDNGPGEEDVFKEGKTTFPHLFTNLSDTLKLERIKETPFGNDLLADFFFELLKNEKPGQGPYCDFVALSFSSPDYIGHSYGPNSMEVMDTYLKLDNQIARILDSLDKTIGKGNYLVFLTADHAVKPNSTYLETNRVYKRPSVIIKVKDQLTNYCKNTYGSPRIIEHMDGHQIYLNYDLMDSLKLDHRAVTENIVGYIRNHIPSIGTIRTKEKMFTESPTRSMGSFLLNGFKASRSGDILFETNLDYTSFFPGTGTTHGSSYDYDSHVPLIFYGWHIQPGESNEEVFVIDIAPTITNLIHIQDPDGTTGVPIVK
jgi:predicted AlkP superfamily pyrophosphatase or phosphodiesterase